MPELSHTNSVDSTPHFSAGNCASMHARAAACERDAHVEARREYVAHRGRALQRPAVAEHGDAHGGGDGGLVRGEEKDFEV